MNRTMCGRVFHCCYYSSSTWDIDPRVDVKPRKRRYNPFSIVLIMLPTEAARVEATSEGKDRIRCTVS